MPVAARSVAAALAAIVGREYVVDEPAALTAAAVDGVTPRFVAAPATVEETARVVALAHDAELAVVPRGSGAALALGRPPARVDLLLDLRRLDRLLEYNPDDLTVSVQAGVTGAALAARLVERRQLFPVDPPGWSARTIGGMTATRAAGPLRARYGSLRDLLLGVRFVQADGVVTWGGAKVVKSVTGYDVPKLMVGALGTLGVLTELTLRLHPAPEFEATRLVAFAHPAAVQEFLAYLLDSPLQPNRVEVVGPGTLAPCALPRAGAGLVLSIATVEGAVRAQDAQVAALAERLGGRTESMGSMFWRTYDRALAGAAGVHLRVGTLPARVGATVEALERELTAPDGGPPLVAGGAALGTLHAVAPASHPDLAAAIGRLRALLADGGGSVVIERAPRALREAVDPWGPVAADRLALMRALKAEFDPRGVLNPGRFVGGL